VTRNGATGVSGGGDDGIDRRRFVRGVVATGLMSSLTGCPSSNPDGSKTPANTDGSAESSPGTDDGRGTRSSTTVETPDFARNRPALPGFGEPDTPLDAVDPTRLSPQVDMLLTTLQGVVNRERPRVYVPRLDPNGETLWPESVGLEVTYHDDPWTVVGTYVDEVEGVVVYDPEVGTTVNAATTVAGIEDVVAAHPSQVDRLRDEYDLEVVRDLRGAFDTETEVYRWMVDTLLPDTSDRVVASLPPASSITGDQRAADPGEELPPYTTVARQDGSYGDVGESTDTFEVDLTGAVDVTSDSVYLRFDDLFPEDGFGARLRSVTVETGAGGTVADFRPNTDTETQYIYDDRSTGASDGYRFADGDDYWVYEFAIPDDVSELVATVTVENEYLVSVAGESPPRPGYDGDDPRATARDYAVATGAMTVWLDADDPTEREVFDEVLSTLDPPAPCWGFVPDEVGGVRHLSEHEVFLGPSDFFRSGTVWAGTNPEATAGIRRHHPERVDPPDLENKVYVTITLSEGDNLQYCQNALKTSWEDDDRGEVPINWSISPLLWDVAPRYLEYFYETATDNDHFMCGPSGVGYAYPEDWPADSFGEFTDLTGAYLADIGVETLYALNRLGVDSTLSPAAVAAYERDTDLLGVALGWDGPSTRVAGEDLVVSHGINGLDGATDPDGITDAIREAVPDDWDGDRPVFLSVGVFGFEVTPSTVREVAADLDDRFEVVRGDVFFQLAAEAL
jgi:hypothetical protein